MTIKESQKQCIIRLLDETEAFLSDHQHFSTEKIAELEAGLDSLLREVQKQLALYKRLH
jgi:ElaB/YqjD/DUF883 family membrane-anchored ribosome-binding protein